MAINVSTEDTPNPNARRFKIDKPVQDSSRGRFFRTAEEADDPLAVTLLGLDGVDSVMLLPTSITVNKSNDADWSAVEAATRTTLDEYFS